MADATEIPPLTFTYTNWRGETATRTVRPIGISYTTTEWHPEPGWLLHAYDDKKKAGRDFAFSGFAAPQPAASDVPHDVAGYVHTVPDHCDRIVWRGIYHHLPLSTPAPSTSTEEALRAENARLLEMLRSAFDGDDVPRKNIALRKAHAALSR
ncbi:MAG: hypothetical protein Unbinned2301contig1004_46 [Prokaryotic dsDNA virus sp.]|nr:MAG: hypothetical protein Unbinned2301contig1004_46 [Prokaryotic dsDNA virus sp.]|tara:strand:- start:16687 stop:17145 length:459 start_codon:yes stop_codon:yes gene_type:complete